MNTDLYNYQFSPVVDYKYAHWFQRPRYNGKTLNEEERKEFVQVIDETVSDFTSGLPMLKNELDRIELFDDAYTNTCRIIYSVTLFVVIVLSDCLVSGKYFLLANNEYDKQFMRGKMKILLNEGFKKLYGFPETNKNKSEWNRLLEYLKPFPEIIHRQYQDLTFLLEKESRSFSWWKDERDLETHIYDAERLYETRSEKIEESKVMMEAMHLFDALMAVNGFLTNAHACLRNYLVEKNRNGELKEE